MVHQITSQMLVAIFRPKYLHPLAVKNDWSREIKIKIHSLFSTAGGCLGKKLKYVWKISILSFLLNGQRGRTNLVLTGSEWVNWSNFGSLVTFYQKLYWEGTSGGGQNYFEVIRDGWGQCRVKWGDVSWWVSASVNMSACFTTPQSTLSI